MCAFRIKPPRHRKAVANEAVSDVLNKVGFDPAKLALFKSWDREVKGLIRGCEAVALQGTRLWVRVPSVIHRQELYYSKDRLIKKLNQAMGQNTITDIRFEFGPSAAPKNQQKKGGTLRGENPTGRWNRSFRRKYV